MEKSFLLQQKMVHSVQRNSTLKNQDVLALHLLRIGARRYELS
jgi:hypothetical protein